ncbi:histidine phosphatase family protein [Paenibacillus lautus]|uniref:histidine phosphatase family protein n=1 Tax=Paenibacillus lautus TaxID=1401 RepID=UPI003D285263
MANILLVRHGEVDWNIEKRLVGQFNLSLNEKGVNQAKKVAMDLADRNLDYIYCSPLDRTIQTYYHIAKYHKFVNFKIDKRITAKHHGHLQGVLVQDIEKLYPQYEGIAITNSDELAPSGGETKNEVRKRVYNFLDEFNLKADVQILIITHMAIIRIINEYFGNSNKFLANSEKIPKCTIFEINVNTNRGCSRSTISS